MDRRKVAKERKGKGKVERSKEKEKEELRRKKATMRIKGMKRQNSLKDQLAPEEEERQEVKMSK